MARVFEEKGFGAGRRLRPAAAIPGRFATRSRARDLEGYLFPETYALPRDTPAREVVRQMVDGFTRTFDGCCATPPPPRG